MCSFAMYATVKLPTGHEFACLPACALDWVLIRQHVQQTRSAFRLLPVPVN